MKSLLCIGPDWLGVHVDGTAYVGRLTASARMLVAQVHGGEGRLEKAKLEKA